MNKLISVIIPTYKRLDMLLENIESINKQSYKNIEIIVIDDDPNSTIGTKISEIKNVKYIKNEKNLNAGKSRSKGYKICNGDYIIFCDDDDVYTDDDFFKNSVDIFEKNKNIDIIFANSVIWCQNDDTIINSDLKCNGIISAKEYLENFQIDYNKPNSTFPAIFKKDVLIKANFDNMQMMNDTPIYLRAMAVANNIYIYKKSVGKYRVHSVNISYNLSSSFIIENLEEKLLSYKNNDFLDKKWIENQIFITTSYFINGSNPNKKERDIVYNWIKTNYDNHFYLILKIRLSNLKYSLKKIIKGDKNG